MKNYHFLFLLMGNYEWFMLTGKLAYVAKKIMVHGGALKYL